MLSWWVERSTVAFPILLGLASARSYSFFFNFESMQHICSYHPFPHITWGKSCGFCKVQVAEQATSRGCQHLLLNFVRYPNLKKRPWRQHPPTVLAVLTVKPKVVGAFPVVSESFLSLWPWPCMAIWLLGGLQCAKAFNGFMSSCDLGPDSWGWKCRYHVSEIEKKGIKARWRWTSGSCPRFVDSRSMYSILFMAFFHPFIS